MTNEPLVPVLATVFTGIAVLMVGLTAYARTPIPLFVALACGLTAGIMWYQATGRLERRMFRTARRRRRPRTGTGNRRHRSVNRRHASTGPTQERTDAYRVLGVEPDADWTHIRRAYRERAKRSHPDNPDGSEAAFKRVTEAYERLRSQ